MKKIFYLFILMAFVLNIYPNISTAVTLPWSTTYDCADWTQSDGQPSCDGLIMGGSWTTQAGSKEQISADANYPGGGGGKGQIHWEGDGQDNNSGGLILSFDSPQSELWMRWYMKYEIDFHWDFILYDKILYFKPDAKVFEFRDEEHMMFYSGSTNNDYYTANGTGWDAVMSAGKTGTWVNGETHQKGDGLWHLYEIHFKLDTNGTDGILEVWVDGVNILLKTDADYGGPTSTTDLVLIGSNNYNPNNGRDMAIYFDDIAVSNTGYIGPIGAGGGDIPPAAPAGIKKSQ